MSTFLEYLLYATAFIAVVFAVEGVGRLLQSSMGEARTIGQRLAKARRNAAQGAADPGKERLSQSLAARFPRLQAALTRADARFNALQLIVGALALSVGALALLSTVGAPPLVACGAAIALGVGTPYLLLAGMASRRRKRFLDQLPHAVDLIARSLQAGHPVTTAMTVVGQRMPAPLGAEFRLVIEEMTYGLDREHALANMLVRFPLPELRMFVASLEVTRETGGNLAEVFLKLGEAIRAKDHLRRKIHAISAEGRMTFWVVTGLPFLVGCAIFLLRPQFFTDVASDSLFWPMMAFAPVTLTIGATMIWRMVNLKI